MNNNTLTTLYTVEAHLAGYLYGPEAGEHRKYLEQALTLVQELMQQEKVASND